MHLVSLAEQRVRVPEARVLAGFAAGVTEVPQEYEPEDVDRIAADAGFRRERRWVDRAARFALTLYRAVPEGRRGGTHETPGACAHIAGLSNT